jgi:hypothetical protein
MEMVSLKSATRQLWGWAWAETVIISGANSKSKGRSKVLTTRGHRGKARSDLLDGRLGQLG